MASAWMFLPRLFARFVVPVAADMEVWRVVSSFIIFSLRSGLSACTVWACWRRLSRRENCLAQWHWKGRSPVCFLMKEESEYRE